MAMKNLDGVEVFGYKLKVKKTYQKGEKVEQNERGRENKLFTEKPIHFDQTFAEVVAKGKQGNLNENKNKPEREEGELDNSSQEESRDTSVAESRQHWLQILENQRLHTGKLVELERACFEMKEELRLWREGVYTKKEREAGLGDYEKKQLEKESIEEEINFKNREVEEEASKVAETSLEEEQVFENNKFFEDGVEDTVEIDNEEETTKNQSEESRKNRNKKEQMRKKRTNRNMVKAKRNIKSLPTLKRNIVNVLKKNNKNNNKVNKKSRYLGPCTGYPNFTQGKNLEGNTLVEDVDDDSSRTITGDCELEVELQRKEKLKELLIQKEQEEAKLTMEIGTQVGVVFKADTTTVLEKLVEMEKRSKTNN